MPLFEYLCADCRRQFELLVRAGDTPACPHCRSRSLERLLSAPAVSTSETKRRAFNRAVKAADRVRHDKERAHQEYVATHHDERHDH